MGLPIGGLQPVPCSIMESALGDGLSDLHLAFWPMKTINAIKYLFTLIGVSLLVGALLLFWHTRTFIDQAATAHGTVIDLVESRSDKSTTYRPVVRFASAQARGAVTPHTMILAALRAEPR